MVKIVLVLFTLMFPVSANEVRKCKAFIIYLFIYLFIYLEPLTQLIMQSQPTLMITMAIAVAIHGTTPSTLNKIVEQDLISLGLRGQI